MTTAVSQGSVSARLGDALTYSVSSIGRVSALDKQLCGYDIVWCPVQTARLRCCQLSSGSRLITKALEVVPRPASYTRCASSTCAHVMLGIALHARYTAVAIKKPLTVGAWLLNDSMTQPDCQRLTLYCCHCQLSTVRGTRRQLHAHPWGWLQPQKGACPGALRSSCRCMHTWWHWQTVTVQVMAPCP